MAVRIKRKGGEAQPLKKYESVLEALWVWPARKDQPLYIVNKKTGRTYKVVSYNPVTKQMVLENDTGKHVYKFNAQMTVQANEDYAPVWR